MAIQYTDGTSVESRICEILEESQNLSSTTRIGGEHYSHWPIRYHLSPERGNLLRPFCFDGLDVLEIGAGMGAVSRILAERSRSLRVIEGTPARFRGIRARLRDLHNWTGEVAEFSSVRADTQYDAVAVIGVLEYAERFVPAERESSQMRFLERVRSFTKSDGVLILAIENAVGLKYWGGAAEDHNGTLFDGIIGYSDSPGPRTFSSRKLQELLEATGFSHTMFYYPFPDYKVPTCLLTDAFMEASPETAASLACQRPFENYCTPRVRYFPDSLSTMAVAKNGLLGDLSNSFLVFASQGPSPTLRKLVGLDALAWHFNENRQTEFLHHGQKIVVRKDAMTKALIPGEPLRFELVRSAYFGHWDAFLDRLEHFLKWSFAKHRYQEDLEARSVDAVFLNAIRRNDDYSLFDLEWIHQSPVPKHWFVFRNVFALIRDFDVLSDSAPFRDLRSLYENLCLALSVTPQFEQDIEREADFQHRAFAYHSRQHHREELLRLFLQPLPPSRFPRDPKREFDIRERLRQLETENSAMKAFFSRRSVKLARGAARFLKKMTSNPLGRSHVTH